MYHPVGYYWDDIIVQCTPDVSRSLSPQINYERQPQLARKGEMWVFLMSSNRAKVLPSKFLHYVHYRVISKTPIHRESVIPHLSVKLWPSSYLPHQQYILACKVSIFLNMMAIHHRKGSWFHTHLREQWLGLHISLHISRVLMQAMHVAAVNWHL